jgi:hypothetical protein
VIDSRDEIAEFRREYRDRFSEKFYNGPLHVLLIAGLGTAAVAYHARRVKKVKPAELLALPGTFLFANFFEWWMHSKVLHVPRKGLLELYTRHALNHHRFFGPGHMTYDNTKDYRIVFFPPFAILAQIGLSTIPGYALSKIFSKNVGELFMSAASAMYLTYEVFHFCSHLPEGPVVSRIPFINTMRRHHAVHHDMRVMTEVNMNLTFPIADWVLGTSDLDRDLVGHLLNGYDTTYVKPELRAAAQ